MRLRRNILVRRKGIVTVIQVQVSIGYSYRHRQDTGTGVIRMQVKMRRQFVIEEKVKSVNENEATSIIGTSAIIQARNDGIYRGFSK